jgi:hypothetical protein
MALVKSDLSSDILEVFNSMKDNYKTEGYDGDKEFCEGLGKAFKDFGESGSISTTDAGTVSAGTFAGTGTGSLSLDSTETIKTLKSAVKAMKENGKDDDYLAGQIKKALQDMYDASDIVSTTVNGAITPPSGSLITITGASGKGTIECDFSSVESGLKTFFALMKDIDNGKTDSDLADKIADLVYSAVKSGVVSTNDEGEIEGASGEGTIS